MFEALHPHLPKANINTTAASEHNPEIEWQIRLVKQCDCDHGILNTSAFQCMPQLMLIALTYHVVLWLNILPSKLGVSNTLLTKKSVLCHHLDFKKHCKAPFGTYCEAHEKPMPTNIMAKYSHPAIIILGPADYLNSKYKFFSLKIGPEDQV